MKIGFYNPYFDGYGGGERYTLTLAAHWSKSHDVSIFWHDKSVLSESERRFGLDLSKIQVVDNVFSNASKIQKLSKSFEYDVIFFVSDGSTPFSVAKHNILHFQIPFEHVNLPFFKQFDAIVCNSAFTKSNMDKKFSDRCNIIYPPVTLLKPTVKNSSVIVSVGRFTPIHTAKKQEILIDAFKKLYQQNKKYTLTLAGGLIDQDRYYLDELQKKAKGYPIDFLVNCTYEQLVSCYQEASIYWHAAGFQETNPQYMEHFGISTVEAMSTGAIPLVYNAGGLPEIVDHKKNGFLWTTVEELVQYTQQLSDKSLHKSLQEQAVKKSKLFSESRFFEAYDKLLQKIVI